MLYSRQETLEDALVQRLLRGPSSIKELHKAVSEKSPVSLRAVYKATDALLEAGVVFKVGKKVWINQEWTRAVRERLSPSVQLLSPGERAVYTFTSAEHLNVFWKTIAFQLEEGDHGRPFFYNPHNFWAYIPELKESEDEYYAQFAREKKHAYFVVGGTSEADKEFKRGYQNDFLQIDARTVPSLGRRDHITVLGDFVITARLSQKLTARLDELYETEKPFNEILPDILRAYTSDATVRLVFEHNAAKAKKLRAILSKNFVVQ
jgi:hypothetical protein